MPREQRHRVTLAILAVAALAYSLQQTMVVPALPAFQRELGSSPTWTAWILTAFFLVSAVSTPVIGRLGDQFGKQRLLLVSMSFFLAGSIAAAAAWDIWSLIGCRALQGLGGGIFPLSFSIIRDEFPRERIGSAIGLISSTFGLGGALGLLLSGLIVDNISWRWIFGLAACVTAPTIVLIARYVPASPVRAPSRVDVAGAALLAGALASLLLAISEGNAWGWSSGWTVGLFVAAAALFAAWALAELRVPYPMVDLRTLRRRTVLFTNVTAVISGFATFGSFILVPALVQTPHQFEPSVARLADYGFGETATKSGLYLVPSALVMLLVGPLNGILGRRFGYKLPLALGLALGGAACVLLAELHDRPWQVVLALLALGAGTGFAFAAMPTLITQAVEQTETGVATGLNTVLRTIGGTIGTQVVAAILAANTVGGTALPAESAYVTAFWVTAVASLVGVVAALLVTPRSRLESVLAPEAAR